MAGRHPGTGEGGGTAASVISEVRGTRGSLPEGTSQPDDPGGVGGFPFTFPFNVLVKFVLRYRSRSC